MYQDKYWLNVYPAGSGQWAGQVSLGDELMLGIAGCSSPEEVEEAAYEQFPEIEDVMRGYHAPRGCERA